MFIPLVDILRCVRPHPETWLVASIERAEERYILEGTLGCPTCLAEYPIRGGVVYFSTREARTSSGSANEHEAMRLAAALDLTEPRMTALLCGRWGAHAQLVRAFSPSQLILLNPPSGLASGDGVSIIVSDAIPLAQQSVDAIAIDESLVTLEESSRSTESEFPALRRSGRLLGPVDMPLPTGFTQLARDDDIWVARADERVTVSAPILPTRRAR